MKIEIYRSKTNRQHYFRIRSRNGRIVAQSEGYKRRRSAVRTASLISHGWHEVSK